MPFFQFPLSDSRRNNLTGENRDPPAHIFYRNRHCSTGRVISSGYDDVKNIEPAVSVLTSDMDHIADARQAY